MRGVSSIARTLKLHFHTSFFPGVPSNVPHSYESRETLLGDIALWKPDSDPERAKLVSSQERLPISIPPWHSCSDWEEGAGNDDYNTNQVSGMSVFTLPAQLLLPTRVWADLLIQSVEDSVYFPKKVC